MKAVCPACLMLSQLTKERKNKTKGGPILMVKGNQQSTHGIIKACLIASVVCIRRWSV